MYDELAPNENASQYEDILKKGIANISIKVDKKIFLIYIKLYIFFLVYESKGWLKKYYFL